MLSLLQAKVRVWLAGRSRRPAEKRIGEACCALASAMLLIAVLSPVAAGESANPADSRLSAETQEAAPNPGMIRLAAERDVTLLPLPIDGCRRGYWLTQEHCCQIGREWDGKRCAPQVNPHCPPGTAGKYPRCEPVRDTTQCPEGWSGEPPVCCRPELRYSDGRCIERSDADEEPDCGRGRYSTEGHCCPRGTIWNGKRCLRQAGLRPSCPRGMLGNFPDCRSPSDSAGGQTCPSGTTGNFPNCVSVNTCPQGMVGAPPNCRRIQVQTCPGGTRGRYPDCDPIVRTCPPGTTGVPPLCRRFDGRPCPPGTVGSPGRCLVLQAPRVQVQPVDPIELQRQRSRQIIPPVAPRINSAR